MFAAVLGIAIGFALYYGPLSLWQSDVSYFASRIVEAASTMSVSLISKLPYASSNPKLVAVLSTVVAVAAPGIIALILVSAANAAGAVRQFFSGLLIVLALASFFVLPFTQAFVVLLLTGAVTALLFLPAVFITRIILWSLATVLAFDHVLLIWSASSPSLAAGTQTLVQIAGFGSTEFWRYALVATALAPFAISLTAVFGRE
jgi:hypothetical protein